MDNQDLEALVNRCKANGTSSRDCMAHQELNHAPADVDAKVDAVTKLQRAFEEGVEVTTPFAQKFVLVSELLQLRFMTQKA